MNLLWGCALIVSGLIIIINVIFGINLPVIKILFAGFLIYLGLKLLMPSHSTFSSYSKSYSSWATTSSNDKDNYSISFSSSVVDLRHLTTQTVPETITIDVQFANAVVLLPNAIPLRVKANVHCAAVNLPGQEMSSEYVNLQGASQPTLNIYINARFANVVVKE